MKKILFDWLVSHYQPPLILSPPIDRWPNKLENRTHVLADRNLRDFRILRGCSKRKCGIRTVKNQRVAEMHRIMLVQSSPSSGNIAASRTPLSSWHPPRWAKGSCAWYKTVRCHRWKQSARNCNNEQFIDEEDSVWLTSFPLPTTSHSLTTNQSIDDRKN